MVRITDCPDMTTAVYCGKKSNKHLTKAGSPVQRIGGQTWGNCNSNCNVIVMNHIFKVMESNL